MERLKPDAAKGRDQILRIIHDDLSALPGCLCKHEPDSGLKYEECGLIDACIIILMGKGGGE